MTERVASIHFDSSNRSIFFDEDSRFELDVSGFGENVSRIAQTFSLTLDACLNKIQSIEVWVLRILSFSDPTCLFDSPPRIFPLVFFFFSFLFSVSLFLDRMLF